MEIDHEEILSLAREIDNNQADKLASLFIVMLDEEHAARHQTRPKLIKKFIDLIDSEGSEN